MWLTLCATAAAASTGYLLWLLAVRPCLDSIDDEYEFVSEQVKRSPVLRTKNVFRLGTIQTQGIPTMLTNTNPETGLAYGVLDARDAHDLFMEIMDQGTNMRLEATVAEMLAALRSMDEDNDLDAMRAYGNELGMLETEIQFMLDTRQEVIERFAGTELPDRTKFLFDTCVTECYRDLFEEAAWRCMNTEECPYSYERPSDGESSYVKRSDQRHQTRMERYELFYLGGAPLILVVDSPYSITCRPCSPCVPYAGDLNNLDEYGSTVAHCPPMSEWGEDLPKYKLGPANEHGVHHYELKVDLD